MTKSIFLVLPDDLEEALDPLTLLPIQHELWLKDGLRKTLLLK